VAKTRRNLFLPGQFKLLFKPCLAEMFQSGFYPHDAMCKCSICCRLVSLWMSVTCWYCVSTITPILKLFLPSGSPIILVFDPLCYYPIRMGTPSAEHYIHGMWKIGDFPLKSLFILEMVQDRSMVTM